MKPLTNPDRIMLRIEAYTDPAGKYDASAPLNGNEDNFFVSDHGDSAGLVTELPQGLLIAVADGMGGLNAGEVASSLAIETVTKFFTQEKIAAMASHNGPTRQMYLERIIRQADVNIKNAQRQNASQSNMGSTIVLAWLMGNELVVSWCGDSRAYIYNAAQGLRLITHDHSYVQELVDRGAITYDQAFDHPQNNIVTRSLGDPQHDAKPESCRLTMHRGDILMVCTDGLTGVLRDKKAYDANQNPLPEMNMEDIFRSAPTLKDCRAMLWDAASKSGWYDNVTAVLCEMVEGPNPSAGTNGEASADTVFESASAQIAAAASQEKSIKNISAPANRSRSWMWTTLIVVAVAIVAILAYLFMSKDTGESQPGNPVDEETIYLNQEEGPETTYGGDQTAPRDNNRDTGHNSEEAPQHNKAARNTDGNTGAAQTSGTGTQSQQPAKNQDGSVDQKSTKGPNGWTIRQPSTTKKQEPQSTESKSENSKTGE